MPIIGNDVLVVGFVPLHAHRQLTLVVHDVVQLIIVIVVGRQLGLILLVLLGLVDAGDIVEAPVLA